MEEVLSELGLTSNEIKVYIALLKIGESSTSAIISEAKTSSGKIYEILDKLIDKGLVSISMINGVKHFQSTSPKSLLELINAKKEQLRKNEDELASLIPKLDSLRKNPSFSSEVLKTSRSIKPLIEKLIADSRKPILAMGIRGDKKSGYNNFWWHITYELMERKKKNAHYLFVEDKSDYFKKHKSLRYVESRTIKTISPIAIDIFDDDVLILNYEEDELQCVHITNASISQSFRSFFDTLWNTAR
ncbi:hypothetical protein H6503_00765 [Candidatus Woesearchaeota archaeon]|nr:hypothetical protein [Candidatus Woesearchaeota archaeon]